MRTGLRTGKWLGLIVLAAASGAAQTTSSSAAPGIAIRSGQFGMVSTATAGFIGAGPPFERVSGHPYSAEQVTEHVQTLADGTHITRTAKVMLYRDSEGRTRTEHIFMPPPGAAMVSTPAFIEITDPVAGYRYMLNQRNQVAQRTPWSPAFPRMGSNGTRSPGNQPATNILPALASSLPANSAGISSTPASERPHPEMSREPLGTQNIEGVTAEGVRMTITYPEGFLGNDRPITTVSETWTSPDLKTVVLSKVSDPRNGDSTTRMTNISQTEPDPSLFQVPAEYSVVDEQQRPVGGAAPVNR